MCSAIKRARSRETSTFAAAFARAWDSLVILFESNRRGVLRAVRPRWCCGSTSAVPANGSWKMTCPAPGVVSGSLAFIDSPFPTIGQERTSSRHHAGSADRASMPHVVSECFQDSAHSRRQVRSVQEPVSAGGGQELELLCFHGRLRSLQSCQLCAVGGKDLKVLLPGRRGWGADPGRKARFCALRSAIFGLLLPRP